MIYLASSLLFALAFFSLYVLIRNNKNFFAMMFLVPIILSSSIYAGYTIYILQGTPISRLPIGEVEVIWAEVQKPDIVLLVRHKGNPTPKYYRILYTRSNSELMQRLNNNAKNGKVQKGEFKPVDKDKTNNIKFDKIRQNNLPPKRSRLENEGVDGGIIERLNVK